MPPFEVPWSNVFINYRRGDVPHATGRVQDRITTRFGDDKVFYDVAMPSGVDYVKAIAEALDSCVALLAVIGPQWVDAVDDQGNRRLDDPSDIVVREIATALEMGITVIPLLIDGTKMPTKSVLPEKLHRLARCNAETIGHSTFERDLEALMARLETLLSSQLPITDNVPTPPNEMVPRPELFDDAVAELLRDGRRGIVALTGLTGAGGFGKTTLASMIARDSRLVARFSDGIEWVTLGENISGLDLASKVNDLCFRLSGTRPLCNDPEQAGLTLGKILAKKQCLLIVDDVWRVAQLAPFLQGGSSCRRLVTTRNRHVLPRTAKSVNVDAMTAEQARDLLSEGFPCAADEVWEPLLERTGKWPVLLSLANRAVHDSVESGLSVADAARQVAGQLAVRPTALDITEDDERRLAVQATIEVSLSMLAQNNPDLRDRFLELAVFPEDSAIPQLTLEIYWASTAGLSVDDVRQVCRRLHNLSLVQGYRADEKPRLWLHDVIGAYLRTSADGRRTGRRLPDYHQALLDAFRENLPSNNGVTAWWELPDDEPYLWRHLTYHLHQAGQDEELNSLVCDFRWIHAVIHRYSPVEVESDLAYGNSALAHTLRQAIAQSPNVSGRLKPHNSLASTLLSSLRRYPALADYVAAAAQSLTPPYLLPTYPLHAPPHPAQRRVLTSNFAGVTAIAISPDGAWLATGSDDGTIELWNTDNTPRITLDAHTDRVTAVAISPDGAWLATGSADDTVRLWNADGALQTTISAAFFSSASSVAISPDGTWLATGSDDGTIGLWNTDNTPRITLDAHTDRVSSVAISPDGTWFASGSNDGTIGLWNTDGTPRITLEVDREPFGAVAISPDGTWFASGSNDGTVRLWNTDGTPRITFIAHTDRVTAVAISPDGTWFATGSNDGTIQLWNTDGTPQATLDAHADRVSSVAISPDGTWLATGSNDHTVRLWNTSTKRTSQANIDAHTDRVTALAISPDGSWLATGGDDDTVRLWNTDGTPRITINTQGYFVTTLTISPDGTWLATSSEDGTVEFWNTDGTPRDQFHAFHGPVTLAISPDSSWFATGDNFGTVQLWNADGTLRTDFKAHTRSITAVAISP
ncbi:NB-ARC domain-containing protein, partial [Saccharopolyspora shandongensis]|uniref:NB-ARC domain-containing protein n=1 Tax=Saccharopolyspora shandongensis TaxID=418495 RepID=UPI0033EBA18E